VVESPRPDAERTDDRSGSRISLQTLIIASLASAAASFAASRIWGPGTLISAAAPPVVVALVSEFLRRPVQTVSTTAKRFPAAQSLPVVRKRTIAAPEDPTRLERDPPITAEPNSPSGQRADPRGRVELPAGITPDVDSGTITHTGANAWRPRWRLALVTGLVAFAIVVALYTVPELLAGRSITGNGEPTTFFGGSGNVKQTTGATRTVTITPTTTITKTAPRTTRTTTPATTNTTTPATSTTTPAVKTTVTLTTPAP
jgi:hypothetical protein